MLVVVGAGSWLLFANRGTRADDTMRGRADASAPLVAAVTADDSLRLAWPAERDVRAYRVELLDDAGEVVSSREGSDTTAIWSVRAVASARRAWVRTTRVNGSTRITPAITLPKMPTTPR